MFTRQDYLNGTCTHRQYYAQFVGNSVRSRVLSCIGLDMLKKSSDRSFNDIPLVQWDRATHNLPLAAKMSDMGDYPTLAGLVCILKEAAEQIREEFA